MSVLDLSGLDQSASKVKVLVVAGTRPEAIKLVPIILALKESRVLRPLVVSTGQHHKMVKEVFGLAGIESDYKLWVGGARNQLNDRVREVMGRLDDFCREEFGADGSTIDLARVASGQFPMAILVHGDTTSAYAAALASFHLRIPVIHVEAGLRTGSSLTPFPEEINRQLITCLASFNLAPTSHNLENLIKEDVPVKQIFVTGNTGIDALHWAAGLNVEISDPEVRGLCESDRRLIVVTAHRRENWGKGLDGIAAGIKRLAEAYPDVAVIVPMHPNPDVRERWSVLADLENVCLTEPAPYAEFAEILARSYLVITDSGGIQEEAPSLGKPVLVARDSTEREEGVEAGTLRLVGTNPDLIFAEASRLLDDDQAYREMSRAENPYGDGRAAERIVAALTQLCLGGPHPEQFSSHYSRRAVTEAAGFVFDTVKIEGMNALTANLPDAAPAGQQTEDREAGGVDETEDVDEIWPSSGTVIEDEEQAQPWSGEEHFP